VIVTENVVFAARFWAAINVTDKPSLDNAIVPGIVTPPLDTATVPGMRGEWRCPGRAGCGRQYEPD